MMKYLLFMKTYINLIFFILNICLLSFVYGNASNWFIKANNVEISIDEFNSDFLNYLKFEFFTNSKLENEVDTLKTDEKMKAAFLQNYINDLLILQEAKEKKLFNPEEIDQLLISFSKILKRVMIKKIFLIEVIKPTIKELDPSMMEEAFNNISKNPNSKNLTLDKKKQIAENNVLTKQIEIHFIEKLNELRGKNIIKINDDFF